MYLRNRSKSRSKKSDSDHLCSAGLLTSSKGWLWGLRAPGGTFWGAALC